MGRQRDESGLLHFSLKNRRSWTRWLLLASAILLGLPAHRASGLDARRRLSQYGHSAWRTQDGEFGGTPVVITQTADGYLWVGTNIGLVRYNGDKFQQWLPPQGMRLIDPRVFALGGGSSGSLWIGTGSGPAQWRDGRMVNYRQLGGRTENLTMDAGGATWMARSQVRGERGPLCRIDASGVRCFTAADAFPFNSATHVVTDRAGNLWIGSYYGLCRWKPGSASTYFLQQPRSDEGIGSIKGLSAAPDGSVWESIETPARTMQLEQFQDGQWTTHSYPAIKAQNADVLALFVDSTNYVWLGTAHDGIYRIHGEDVEHFGSGDGLSSDAIGSFFEDREGNVWVVTSAGIDKFHDLPVVNFSMREGLYADGASSVFAGHDGTVWVGNFQSLNMIRDGKISAIREGAGFPGRNVTTLLEDHSGRIWLGIDNGLWVYENDHFRPIQRSDGGATGNVFSICEDAEHTIWVRAGTNLYEVRDYKVQSETTSPNISRAYIMTAHPEGGVVMGLVNGDLLRYVSGRETLLPERIDDAPGQNLPAKEEDPGRHVRDLLVRPDGAIWGTTTEEFFIWKDGKRESLTMRNGLPCDNIFGLLDDHRGALWLSATCGLIKIQNEEIERWQRNPRSEIRSQLVVGSLDGVQPGLTSLKPQIVATRDGKIWLVNGRMLQMFDPYDQRRNEIAPSVVIERVTADGNAYPTQAGLQFPPKTHEVEIDFAALSFVIPQKNRFRFRLEGHDQTWREPENRNLVTYEDLKPARYRFRVVACNNDGVWNDTGATLEFTIKPAYYQTLWFQLLCALFVLTAAWLMYRIRMWRLRESINARFDERMAERTRVAREIHDTLLQTIQGSKMVADDALEEDAGIERKHRALERVSLWLGQAATEGRAALNSLRASTTQVNDLAEALERAAKECSANRSIEFVLQVEGTVRQMHPVVRDEVYRIGYEAIRNACMHSGGTRMEIELTYARTLTLSVRDNGKGIHPQVAAMGKEGHFGLKGMHERAVRVGGSLTLSSSAYSGTEVELVIPGDVVFSQSGAKREGFTSRLRKFLRKRQI